MKVKTPIQDEIGVLLLVDLTGRGERIWTSDTLLPKQVRFQAAPRPEIVMVLSKIKFLIYLIRIYKIKAKNQP